jgi:transcriptional regulator with XRE-family HTH domain
MNYGKAIRTARSIADRSQEDVAKAASINRSYLSSIESGKRTPSIGTLENLTHALNIPMHLLQLLGMEKKDHVPAQEETVKALAIELTRLLLQENKNESRPKERRELVRNLSDARDAGPAQNKKPTRSRSAAGNRPIDVAKAGGRDSKPLRTVSATKKVKAFSKAPNGH